MMTNDFEAHPVGTGKRLAELEGLAFARRRTEYTCPVTDEDAAAARDAYHAHFCPPPPPWVDLDEAYRGPWRRVAEAIRDRLSGREMVAAHSAMCPIDPADVRKGDRVRVVYSVTISTPPNENGKGWTGTDAGDRSFYLLDRPDPDAERVAAVCQRLHFAHGVKASPEMLACTLTELGFTIEPRPTTGDLHA
jgi:hypothetical protein